MTGSWKGATRWTLACLAALAAAGCGDDGPDRPAANDPRNPPFEARVEITDAGYRPKHVKILVGGSVTFVNMDRRNVHTAETEDLPDGPSDSNEFDTHSLTWEEPYTVTFHKPEKVTYRNSLDPDMTGTVEAVVKR